MRLCVRVMRARARVCVCLRWIGDAGETIAVFEAPHGRPCAVDYHTAVRMRSRQKQHDSPTAPNPKQTRATPLSNAPSPHALLHAEKLSKRGLKKKEGKGFGGVTHKAIWSGTHTLSHASGQLLLDVKKERLCTILPLFPLIFALCI